MNSTNTTSSAGVSVEPTIINNGISLFQGFIIGLVMSVYAAIPWNLLFIYTRKYGLGLYTLDKHEDCLRIQKRIKSTSSHIYNGTKGTGYAIGFWYYLYCSNHNEQYDVWMIATEESYKKLLEDTDDDDTEATVQKRDDVTGEMVTVQKKNIHILDRCGSYTNTWYRTRELKNYDCEPRPEQQVIIDGIKKQFELKRRCVALIHGPPNTGKSAVGLLLAKEYGGVYTNSFEPWEPGDTINNVAEEAIPLKEKPLSVSMDEIDRPLERINNTIPHHKNVNIAIKDKTGWNRFFDNFNRGLYPNVIILLTTNKTPSYFDLLDDSYMREGRVDLTFEMRCKVD